MMKIIYKIEELSKYLQDKKGQTIGLVPTMGFLHQGHISLIERAVKENNIVIVSIFVNPTQFGPGEDYDIYPRNIEGDMKILQEVGADVLFIPESKEMYPKGYNTFVEVMKITNVLCGASRPDHFRGVTTIISKLFNITKPNRAYFGQKDAQQCAVIKKMVKDLNYDLEIIVCPIIREKDGLALSSRNAYLNEDERKEARVLFQTLMLARESIENGEKDPELIKKLIYKTISEKKLANLEYVEIINETTLENIDEIKGDVLIALAVKFGKTRLIDNIVIGS